MKTENPNSSIFHSLHDVRMRKEMLLTDIQKDEREIKELWNRLFRKPNALSQKALPSQRFKSIFSNSVGLIDGVILGWKLYRKFKGHKK